MPVTNSPILNPFSLQLLIWKSSLSFCFTHFSKDPFLMLLFYTTAHICKAIVVNSRERIKACNNIHFEQSTRSLWTETTNLCMCLRNLRNNVLDFGVLTDIKVTVWVITIARKNKKQHKAERGYLAYNFRVCSIIMGKSKQELKAWYPESKQRK